MSEPAVIVEKATFRYPAGGEPALVDISLELQPGTITVVAGRTGSGKSTLLKLLAGWIPQHSSGTLTGRVLLAGLNTRDELPPGQVGYVLQSPEEQLCTTTVEAEIAFGLENLQLPVDEIARRIDEALAFCALAELRERPPQQLSGGQQQRLIVAAILAMQPRVLMFDEPLSQLDPVAAGELLDLFTRLQQRGLTLIVAEHRVDELLTIADRLVIVEQGRIINHVATDDRAQVDAALAGIGWRRDTSPPAASLPRIETPPVVDIQHLSARHPRAALCVWNDVSFTIRAGDRIALVGSNGSGKSTLLQTLAGLLRPDSGTIDVSGESDSVWGLVLQSPDLLLFNRSVYDELAYVLRRRRVTRQQIDDQVRQLADTFGLATRLADPPLALSQGQRLRLAVAATCAVNPRVMLLDEPTTGQDPQQIDKLMRGLIDRLNDEVVKNYSQQLVIPAQAGIQSVGEQGWIPACAGMTTRPLGLIDRLNDEVVKRDSARDNKPLGRLQAILFSTHDLRIVSQFATRVLVLAGGRLAADVSVEQFWHDERLRALAGWSPSAARSAP